MLLRNTRAGCKVELVTETERWAEIDPDDWIEGGKYFCVRGKAPERSDASKHVASATNKRKRGKDSKTAKG